ncbi:hypothetical protein A9Q83_16635 [Alphaproteobacteria bacterium 46_93_T64]|nr:hypothetical protein A9Q83_16635 [Alphaproteobacteria bacterium 46_93_T64]
MTILKFPSQNITVKNDKPTIRQIMETAPSIEMAVEAITANYPETKLKYIVENMEDEIHDLENRIAAKLQATDRLKNLNSKCVALFDKRTGYRQALKKLHDQGDLMGQAFYREEVRPAQLAFIHMMDCAVQSDIKWTIRFKGSSPDYIFKDCAIYDCPDLLVQAHCKVRGWESPV